MRQAGMIAAGGLHALNHHIEDLKDDHRRASTCAHALAKLSKVALEPDTICTNIVIFGVPNHDAAEVCAALDDRVRVLPFGPHRIRAVFHRDIDDTQLDVAIQAFADVLG